MRRFLLPFLVGLFVLFTSLSHAISPLEAAQTILKNLKTYTQDQPSVKEGLEVLEEFLESDQVFHKPFHYHKLMKTVSDLTLLLRSHKVVSSLWGDCLDLLSHIRAYSHDGLCSYYLDVEFANYLMNDKGYIPSEQNLVIERLSNKSKKNMNELLGILEESFSMEEVYHNQLMIDKMLKYLETVDLKKENGDLEEGFEQFLLEKYQKQDPPATLALARNLALDRGLQDSVDIYVAYEKKFSEKVLGMLWVSKDIENVNGVFFLSRRAGASHLGIASRLLDFVIKQAPSLYLLEVEADNQPLRALYEKSGFSYIEGSKVSFSQGGKLQMVGDYRE